MEAEAVQKTTESTFIHYFGIWTWFEKIWLTIFTAITIYLFFAFEDSLIGLVSSLTGMLCVVLVAKGKITNYYFGIINTLTYGYLAYTYGLYGDAMLNLLFYFPAQFIGIYLWGKHRATGNVQGEDVVVARVQKKFRLIVLTILLWALYAIFLVYLGGRSIGLDSATTILSVIAQILMIKRYVEQWLVWILVNILSIAMWIIELIRQDGNDWAIALMWTAFLINSIYGYLNWRKLYKKQEVLTK
ncbi:nicotinamide riboside transporter PnuC [Lederbergia lenta]|uniref:Nicotinamide mononucleotide transporter PnuC n=1 Tax=Lederbergia lenta TaxID=1467 RepID=A0A2X4WCR9_LEDLE|nr:nicotinamide riboside transporter PnuC [Lederbergia lenta]MCM3111704.1 nicotinamide riboside transporter PnuC [Lederbergia lenta]MEC2322857.1 nicotinamide riboside transporter PnuC [Lederbergia lenta]SQI61926.1 nicotinamide mononucleotide transporter PnuC [Lederbergia lenta]